MKRIPLRWKCAPAMLLALAAFDGAAAAAFPAKPVWFGIVTTAGTPRVVVEQLNRDVVRAARAPDVAEKFLAQGYEIITHTTPSEFAAFIRDDREKIRRIARTSRIRTE